MKVAPSVSAFDIIGSGLGLLFISVGFFLFGCGSPIAWLTWPKNPPAPAPKKKVQIVSEPVGARIEVNQAYVGDTPIAVKIETDQHGNFAHMTPIVAVPSRSLPNNTPLYTQSVTFLMGQPIPSRLYFDNRQLNGLGIRLGPTATPGEIATPGASFTPRGEIAMPSASPTPPSEIVAPSASPTP